MAYAAAMDAVSKTERRFRTEITAVLVAALVAAVAGIVGAAIGAHASSSAILDQLAQDRQIALRAERYQAFSRLFVAADELRATVTQFPEDGEPIEDEAGRAYDETYQTAYLYGSAEQVEALNHLDDRLDALAKGDATADEQDAYSDAKVELLVLLRKDLQFAD